MFLDTHERFLRYIGSFLNTVTVNKNLSIIDSSILFGRFLLSICLKDPSIQSHFSSSSLPPLDIIDLMPEVAESALMFVRTLCSLYHERFRILHEREDLDIAMGLGRLCVATKANREVPADEWIMSKILSDEYDITLHHGTIIESIARARASYKGAYIDDPNHLIRLSTALRMRHIDMTAEDMDSIIAPMKSAIAIAEKKDLPTSKMSKLRREIEVASHLKADLVSRPKETEVSDIGIVRPSKEDCSPVRSAGTSEYVKPLNLTKRCRSRFDYCMYPDSALTCNKQMDLTAVTRQPQITRIGFPACKCCSPPSLNLLRSQDVIQISLAKRFQERALQLSK